MKSKRTVFRLDATALLTALTLTAFCSCTKVPKGFSMRPQTEDELYETQTQTYSDEDFLRKVEQAAQELDDSWQDNPDAFTRQQEQEPAEPDTQDPEPDAATEDYGYRPLDIPEGDTLEIAEKMFLTQINDMYFNFDSYKDKTIIVEGMYTQLISWDGTQRYPAVYRKGPGCCGNDGWGGFVLKYEGPLPKYDEWIRVTGKPVMERTEDGYDNLYLIVSSLEVKQERGMEFVMQ